MLSNIVSYQWPFDGTLHVAYQTDDDHIHEMVATQHDRWTDSDITRTTGGALFDDALLAASTWQTGDNEQTQQIAYVSELDTSGHIYELVMLQDHPWSIEDILAQPIGAKPADGLTLVGYSYTPGQTKHLVYTGRDGHLHELTAATTGLWQTKNLTESLSAPLPESNLVAAYSWNANATRQVLYTSGDGHIQELAVGPDGVWKRTNLTTSTEAPPANGASLIGFAWEGGNMQQVVYTADSGDLYEIASGPDGKWSVQNLTSLTKAHLPSGSALTGFAWETGEEKSIAYVGGDRHVHLLQKPLQGNWEHIDLTGHLNLPDASDDVIVGHEWTPQFAQHIAFLDTNENPHIHSLLLEHGSEWRHVDLTRLTGAQPLV
jgi:hypothetical protein